MTKRRIRVGRVSSIRGNAFTGRVTVVLEGETMAGTETRVTLDLDVYDVADLRQGLAEAAVKLGNAWHDAAGWTR